jgi:hypothetical protein
MTQSLDAIMADRDAVPSPDAGTQYPDPAMDAQGDAFGDAYGEAAHLPDGAGEDLSGRPERQPGMVPHQALHAERQARRTLERELGEIRGVLQAQAQMQAQAYAQMPQPDPLVQFAADPTGFLQQQVSPMARQVHEMRELVLELQAGQSHGTERVEAAKRAAEQLRDSSDPALNTLLARIANAANPFDELVSWHDDHDRMRQYGDDPEAYIAAEVERRLAGGPPQYPAAYPRALPPSFAGARNGAPRQSQNYGGPRPLSEIMKR